MNAITLNRPWPHAIAYLGKRIENRTWPAPQHAIGKRIAIHAGRRWDDIGASTLRSMGYALPPKPQHPTGIILTARLVGCIHSYSPSGTVAAVDDPWFTGPFGWQLEDIEILPEPFPIKGRQGLWRWYPA